MLREEMMRKARDVPPPPPPETSFDTTSRVRVVRSPLPSVSSEAPSV